MQKAAKNSLLVDLTGKKFAPTSIDKSVVCQKEFDEDLNFMEEKIAKLDERISKRLDELLKDTATLKKHVITMAVSAAAEVASVTITKVFDKFSKDIAKEIEEKHFAVDMKIAEVKEDCKFTRHIQHVTFTRMFGDDY